MELSNVCTQWVTVFRLNSSIILCEGTHFSKSYSMEVWMAESDP